MAGAIKGYIENSIINKLAVKSEGWKIIADKLGIEQLKRNITRVSHNGW